MTKKVPLSTFISSSILAVTVSFSTQPKHTCLHMSCPLLNCFLPQSLLISLSVYQHLWLNSPSLAIFSKKGVSTIFYIFIYPILFFFTAPTTIWHYLPSYACYLSISFTRMKMKSQVSDFIVHLCIICI